MHYYEIAPNQIARAGQTTFTYRAATPLSIGQLVRIELGKKQVNGVVIQPVSKPHYAAKEINRVLYTTPLPAAYLHLATWLASYYWTPLASVLQTMLPRGLEKNRRERKESLHQSKRERTTIVLNASQNAAIKQIEQATDGTSVLHGITGSGKTAVYIALAKKTIAAGRSVIVLVPEIALTSQLVDEFSHSFDAILLTHSKQTEAERHAIWTEALTSSRPRIVIGPRSALFLPLASIGLIVIDEAHEPSYKQEQSPRYSALRAARTLADAHQAKLVLGSATPLVSEYYLATVAKRPVIEMNAPAVTGTVRPTVELIDMTKRSNFKHHRFLSDQLLTRLEEDLAHGRQALLFHNRRGSASTTLCENCGWQAGCPHCYVPLTLHADTHLLRCHICGLKDRVPTSCPQCQHANIIHKGIGTKLIESELRKLFPHHVIARFDGDSTSEATVEQRYKELYEGSIDIIIGTQVIAKGLDLPKLRTVGVIQADAGLSLPDYSSAERTFQLLAQVVGRVGRSRHETHLVIQSYQPTHPIVQAGIAQDYVSFYDSTLSLRKRGYFPPFCHLLKLTCVYKTEAAAVKNAQALAHVLRDNAPSEVKILGPTPAFYERQHDTYRWQLVLKAPKRAQLLEALAHLPTHHWQYELDPLSLL